MLNNIRRDNYINEQIKKGATKIEIYKLPYESYIGCDWGSFPSKKGYWQENFKNYYKLDKNIEITITNKTRKEIENKGL